MMRRLHRHINLLREFSVPLICGSIAALIWANLDPIGYRNFSAAPLIAGISFHDLSNEIFMVLFFGIAAVEITRSCLPGGDLHPLSKAVNPLLGTAGGVLGPVAVYLGLNSLFGAPSLTNGWGIPTATDIALAWLAARMVFGPAHPAVSYLLLLAIADDAVGLLIIAVFYPDPLRPVLPIWLLVTALGAGTAYLLRGMRIRSYWPYIIIGGALSWIGLQRAHLHPALALVFVIPFLPHRRTQSGHFFEEDRSDRSPLATFEHDWKVVVDFGMFAFGLANAGVELAGVSSVTWLVLVSLLVGKTLGIFTFGALSQAIGFRLPSGMRLRDLVVAGMIAGTGFTVALFVAGEAFADPLVRGAAKMGAILSVSAAVAAIIVGKLIGVRRS